MTNLPLALRLTLLLSLTTAAGAAFAAGNNAPSQPGVDAPELAPLGQFDVGVKTVVLVDRDQWDLRTYDPKMGAVPRRDRVLTVDIWYPAKIAARALRETYSATLPAEPPAGAVRFTVPGMAVRNARAAGSRFPLVIVSHGFHNATAGMSWLTENLASKGYVVAAIRHEDLGYADPKGFPHALLRRPLDIAFVAGELQRTLAAVGQIDPARTALIGYSMGGYGVLTAAGGVLQPQGAVPKLIPSTIVESYVRGGALSASLRVSGVKAVVAIAPAGGSLAAWGQDGLGAITAPLLLIAGDVDRTVDYQSGARAFFDMATNSHRYLLTFKGGGHALGLGPVPPEMKHSLWDHDWFEDPVWRKERIISISLHMITAFLDRHVKDDASRDAYLNVAVAESSQARWPTTAAAPYDAYSPGTADITVWKGFQRGHAEGLELLQAKAAP